MNAKQEGKTAEPLQVQTLAALFANASLGSTKTLVSQIYDLLRSLIVEMKLHPGQALSEKEIGELLSASKTPVREAMIRLENDGLVRIVPKSGTYVAPLNLDRYMSACFIRLNLEIGAVRAASAHPERHAFAEKLDALLVEQRKAVDADDYDSFFRLDEDLHKLFFEIAGVPNVWATVQRSQADVHRVRHLRRLQNIKNGEKVIRDHKLIIAAILKGDADGAQSALVDHIGSLDAKFKALSGNPELLEFIETLNSKRVRSKRTRNGSSVTEESVEEICQA